VFQSLKYLQEKYKNRIPLYAGCTAPFTLGGYLWEAEKFLTLPIQDPQRLKAILGWLVTLVGDYAKKLLAAGANVIVLIDPTASANMISPRNVIVLIDPTASANMISPRVFERFILPVYFRLKEIIQGRIILLRVKEDAQRALSEGINLLAPACSIPPETSPENLMAMREAWEDYLVQAY
jgi:[methyl-Co(III) methanol-specific corrinoid protein]:coenzyme M methyltransferase